MKGRTEKLHNLQKMSERSRAYHRDRRVTAVLDETNIHTNYEKKEETKQNDAEYKKKLRRTGREALDTKETAGKLIQRGKTREKSKKNKKTRKRIPLTYRALSIILEKNKTRVPVTPTIATAGNRFPPSLPYENLSSVRPKIKRGK